MKRDMNIACITVFAGCFMATASLSAQTSTGRFTVNMSHGPVVMEIGRSSATSQYITGANQKTLEIKQSEIKQSEIKQNDGIYYDEHAMPSQPQSGIIYDANEKSLKFGANVYKFVKIDNCTFSMGATSEQEGESETSESPRHRVTLFSYWLGATEVPQWLWMAVMDNNPSFNIGDDNPVENVSWNECKEFIARLSQLTGRKFGMPTEAQLELAMRNGKNDNEYKYGIEGNLDDIAWYAANSDGRSHPVGLKRPNGVGLYDIIGNVGEWCCDWYASYSDHEEQSPAGPDSGTKRVFRSGTFESQAKDCRTASRFAEAPDKKSPLIGLRLAL